MSRVKETAKNLLNRYIYIYIYIIDKVFHARHQEQKLGVANSPSYFWLQRSTNSCSGLVFRDIGQARGKGYLPVAASTSLGLILLSLGAFLPAVVTSGSAHAESAITVTITDSSADLGLVSADGGGASGESDTMGFTVSTTSSGGYTTTVSGSNSDGKLTGASSANYFTSIASATEQASSFSNGTWGFKPNKYNSSANTNFRPVPTSSTPATIDVTNAPTTGSYTISVGAKTDTTTAADTYSYDFIVAAVTNSIDYDIVFANAASGMPERMSGSQSGSTVTLPSTKPTMTGYSFKGWCTVSVAPNSTCTGTTYQPGGTYTLASNSNNDVTLYAIWQEAITFDKAYANAGKSKSGDYYAMLDMTSSICEAVDTGEVGTLVDTRDNNTYEVGKLADGKCWMLDNLAFNGRDNKGSGSYIAMNSSNTHVNTSVTWNNTVRTGWTSSSGDSYTSAYINDTSKDTISSNAKDQAGGWKVGVYYNYCAASAGTICADSSTGSTAEATSDVCPAGWKMPSGGPSGDYQALYSLSEYNNYNKYRDALHLPLSGYFYSGVANGQSSYGYWWPTTPNGGTGRYRLYVSTSAIFPSYSLNRRYGASIRCLNQ